MLGLLQIYFLFNIYFILVKCGPMEDLSVRITDKKLIQKQRQDTLDMCKIFNSKTPKVSLPVEVLPANKYQKRKKELKLKEKKDKIQNIGKYRVKRAANVINSKDEGEDIVETNDRKINDDMAKNEQKNSYRRNDIPEASPQQKDKDSAAKKSGRRFPFAPSFLDARTTTTRNEPIVDELPAALKVRFENAIVPYFIDSKTYDTQLAEIIIKAFDYFEKTTCIRLQRLRERPTDEKSLRNVLWLYITNPSGIRQCVHSNEKAEIQGVQMITFGYDCMSQGDIAHEIMHVLGFAHEHVRPDRDQYITILWENIKPGYMQYFEVHNDSIIENLPYDYASVLHYPQRAFSRNGKLTIMTEHSIKIGQRDGLSEMDVEKIGILYSNECIKRNREYLLKTCPSAVTHELTPTPVSELDIDDYFGDKLWPYGVVNYKFKVPLEFTTEEIENINAVIKHIQAETCLQFREIVPEKKTQEKDKDKDKSKDNSKPQSEISEKEDISSSSNVNFNTEELDRVVILSVSNSSEETKVLAAPLDNKVKRKAEDNFLFDFNTGRNGNDKANIGAKRNYTNAGNKLKTTVITFRKAADQRRKRAVPPTPTRRHSSNTLVLTRSTLPGCHCPRPGKPDGNHDLIINADCFNTVNDLLHVFVHVLGLDHQHNMHDRDSYLHIEWNQLTDDIKKEMQNKLPPAASLGLPYDYQSVMHYPWLQIKNGQSNIMYPIWNDGWAMGHWQGLSTTDVLKIQQLYSKLCYERTKQKENAEENEKEDDGTGKIEEH